MTPPPTPWLRIRLLGGCEFQCPAGPVHLETAKTGALLAYLALQPGPQQRHKLMGLLWGDLPEPSARRNLRRALWDLRRKLDRPNMPSFILTTHQTVEFNRQSRYWLDVEQLVDWETGVPMYQSSSLPALRQAVDLYHGDLMAGFYLDDCPAFEEWLLAERERLRTFVLLALQRLAQYHTARGEYAAGIECAVRLLALDPWREEAHRELMTLLALTGQRSAALAQYAECRRLLEAELGLEPLEETVALYGRLVNWEPGTLGDQLTNLPIHQSTTLPFVGREEEHARLVAWWERARRGGEKLALVEGEAGVGKTRLVEEVARYAVAQGAVVLRGRCYEFGSGVPYQPIAAALRAGLPDLALPTSRLGAVWLAELTRLLPELCETIRGLPEPQPVTGEAARQRLFEAVARFLLMSDLSFVLFLDDLHWADQSTLDLLHYLVRRLDAAPVWIVGTYRREEVSLGHPLTRLRQGLGRDRRVDCLTLELLSGAAVGQIARALVGTEAGAALGDFLYRESEGNPFILVETVSDLREQDLLRYEPDERWHWAAPPAAELLPTGVQDVILQRVGRLSEPAQRLLMLAAVIGRQFDAALLRAAAGPDAAAVDESLAEWLARRLVSPQSNAGPGTWDLAHDKIRAVVYHTAGVARQRALHRRVGQGLEGLSAGQPASVCEQLAYHYEHGGDVEKALTYLPLAAAKASAVYAHQEALGYYDRALALLGSGDARRWSLLLQRGRALRFLSRLDEARAACQPVLSAEDRLLAAQAARELSAICQARRDYVEARAWAEKAYQLAGEADHRPASARLADVERARAMLALADVEREQGNLARAQELFAEALERYGALDDRCGVAECLRGLGYVLAAWSRYDDARQYLEEALPMFQTLGDRQNEAACWRAIGTIHWRQCAYGAAHQALMESLDICRAIGDQEGEAQTLNDLGLVYIAQGDRVETQRCWEESATLFRSLGLEKRAAPCLHRLGILHTGQGRYAVAQQYLEESLAISRATGAKLNEALDLGWLGNLYLLLGEYHQSQTCYETALALDRAVGGCEEEIWHLTGLGHAAYELGDRERAQAFYAAASQRVQDTGSLLSAYEGNYRWVALYLEQGDGAAAWRVVQRAIAHVQQAMAEADEQQAIGNCCILLGIVHGSGLLAAAEDPGPYFERALSTLHDVSPFGYGVALRCYGAHQVRSSTLEQGLAHLREARAVFTRLSARGELAKVERLLAGDDDPRLQW